MTFPFVGPVEVPIPTAGTHPTTKSYVDSGLATKADGSHTHVHPLVPNPPFVLTFATSLTPSAANGNYQVCTTTNNLTLNVPTGGIDGQMLRLRFIASGGSYTITFHASLRRPASIASTLVIASTKRGDVGLLYEAADGWTILAAQAQA
jgi:hypothetical protein